jgi:large subunit ribosomal protein L22
MIAKASASFVHISPRKVRYVIDLIRKKPVGDAQAILNGSPRRAGGILRKLLNQALDAAAKNSKVHANDLIVSKVLADGGPSMKRFRAATMGRANRIKKRTSHIQIELDISKVVKTRTPLQPTPVKKEKKSLNKKTVGAK